MIHAPRDFLERYQVTEHREVREEHGRYSTLAHQLSDIFWWPSNLCKAQAPLDTLQELPGDFIAHHVPLVTFVQLFSCAPLMNTHHGDTDRPCCFANTQTEVTIVCIDVSTFLCGFDDFHDRFEYTFVKISFLELAE
jgi:hypothetical protein